jgi:hypothetical protein
VDPYLVGLFAVVILIILVSMAFFLFQFYQWAVQLEDVDPPEEFEFTAQDALYDKNGTGQYFTSLEDLIMLKHTGGEVMNWTNYEFYLEVKGGSNAGYLYIAIIGGEDYSDETNFNTTVSQSMVLRSYQDDIFKSGDVVRFIISYWGQESYRKESITLK